MDNFTSFKFRKIVNTCLIIFTFIFTFLGFVFKNSEFNMIYFQMIFANVLDNTPLVIAIVLGVMLITIFILLVICLPKVLIKNSYAYFHIQTVITIFLFFMIILNSIGKILPTGGTVTLVIALIINVFATAYYVLCYKYHKEEMILEEKPKEEQEPETLFDDATAFAEEKPVDNPTDVKEGE